MKKREKILTSAATKLYYPSQVYFVKHKRVKKNLYSDFD